MKVFIYTFLILSCSLSFACFSVHTTSQVDGRKLEVIPDSLKAFAVSVYELIDSNQLRYYYGFNRFTVASAWKYDSNSCLKVRNYLMAEYLVDVFEISNLYVEDVMKFIGPPNRIHKGQFYDLMDYEFVNHYIYYFDHSCENGIPREGLYRCWLDIVIDTLSQKVVGINWPCI